MAHWLKTIIPLITLALFTLAASSTPFPTYLSQPTQLIKLTNSSNSLNSQNSSQSKIQNPKSKIQTIVNLGVPAGNGATPKHLALNSQAGQLYILSEGVPILKQGSGLSVYNIKTGQIDKHVKINQGDNETLDLQFDPEAGLIYALWNQRYTDTRPTLTVIDSNLLQTVQNIPDIEAFATDNGRLYAANAQELLSVNLPNNSLAQAQRVDLPPAGITGPMAVNPAANRLYLARSVDGVWSMEIFEAGTLAPIGSYPSDTAILNILPLPGASEVLVIAALSDYRAVYRLTTDGELADLPYELGPRYGAAGIALSQDGERLYFSNGQLRPLDPADDAPGPALVGLSSGSNLSPLLEIPLLTNFDDLVIDDKTNQAFALYPFDHFLYVVNLNRETVKIVNTAIEIRDVLVDAESNQIFVSDSANRIRRLNGGSFKVLAEVQLEDTGDDYGFKFATWAGELSLDRERNQLYVSGRPAIVLEADTLAHIATLEPGGQLAPDPSGDNIYVSNCGLTVVDALIFISGDIVPGTGPDPRGLSPNPCVGYSQLDTANQLLYSIVPNGVPGSNGGNHLYVYDVSAEPTLIFTDTGISIVQAEPDPVNRRAFVSYVRHSNQRLRALDVSASGSANYTHHLMGVWGYLRYSPTANRLYLSNNNRLLALDADTLAVTNELSLPPKYNYRLVDLDPATERLYLAGLDGQLLIASFGENGTGPESPPTHMPTGDILALESVAGDILARIKAKHDNFVDTRLYRTQDQGKTWTDLSQNLPPFPIQTMAAAGDDAEPQTIFAGLIVFGQTGGLYKSTDGGQTWNPAMAGLQDLWVEKLFISPNFDQTGLIFAHTTHGGLHQSTDGGQSWTPLDPVAPNEFFPSANSIASVAFDGQGGVLVSQSSARMQGIFRAALKSSGDLTEWQQVLDIPVGSLAFGPDGRVVLAFGGGLWRSIDGGQTWQAGGAGLAGIENLQPDRFLFSPNFAQDQTVYFFFKDISGDAPGLLFRSTDAGQSWQPWLDPAGGDGNNFTAGNTFTAGKTFTAVTLTPDGYFIFGDSGAKLTRLAPIALQWTSSRQWVDSETVASFPLNDLSASPNYSADQTLFALNSQYGLFKSGNGGQSWQLSNFPVRAYRFDRNLYKLAVSPAYRQDQTLFVASGRSLHRSTNGGQTWEQLSLGGGKISDSSFSFHARRVALSPNFGRDRTLLVSTEIAIYRSANSGDTWQQVITPEEEAVSPDILTFAPDGKTAYARFGYGHNLFSSPDGGQTWQKQPGTKEEYFSIIAASTASNGTLTAAVEFSTRLLQTDPQTQLWADIGQSLPAELTGLEAVAYGPDDTLFIGGQGGVFSSANNGQSWQALNDGLPLQVKITNLHTSDAHLFATSADGEIFVSANNGASWTDISPRIK